MATFIHTANWELGGHPADVSNEETTRLLQYDRFVAVRQIGEIARDHRAEFVLVVGKVFHTASPNRATIAEAIRAIASINLPVLIVPSGLDEGISSSVWEQDVFIREAHEHAPNLRVLLTHEPVVQNDCLLFPLFPRGDLRNPREVWAYARKQLALGDPRPRIAIVPATSEADDHGLRPSAAVADTALADVDYVATVGEKTGGNVAVVTAVRGEQPVVKAVPSGSVTADVEHDHALQQSDLAGSKKDSDLEYEPDVLYCPAPAPPPPTDDNVQFTVFRPQVVASAKWYDLIAAAHLDSARPEADPAAPSPLDRVQEKAQAILGDRFDDYAPLTHDALQGVPQGSELTFAFEMPGVEFNPARVSFGWREDEHIVHVRLRAAAPLEGTTARGRMTVFLGAIILADVPFSLRVDAARAADRPRLEPEREAVRRYRRIFASYSHRDLKIVEQFEAFVEATGDRYLRDHKVLRAGEAWDDRLLELIVEADVFQLFWSRNALASPHVRREWEHALSLGRDNFVRPVYWENPLPQEHGLPPEALTRIHFQFLGGIDATAAERTAAAADHEKAEEADAEVDDLWPADHAAFDVVACCPAAADDVEQAASAASYQDGGPVLGSWRGLLFGFGIGLVVVSIMICLITSLLIVIRLIPFLLFPS